MARYEHLPIYKEAFDLALYFEKTVRSMSRYDNYTLGTDLRNLSRDVLKLIQRANSETDRVETLKGIRSRIEELKAVLRLARESGAIAKAKSYECAAGKVVNIGRQNEGWLRSEVCRNRPESRTPRSEKTQGVAERMGRHVVEPGRLHVLLEHALDPARREFSPLPVEDRRGAASVLRIAEGKERLAGVAVERNLSSLPALPLSDD